MPEIIKTISIINPSNTGYDTREIGAEARNIEIPYNKNDEIIVNGNEEVYKVKTLDKVLKENRIGIIGMAPENHADATNKYGAASADNYGHVKIGSGFRVGEDGKLNLNFARENVPGGVVESNDPRLVGNKSNPYPVVFSDGKANPTIIEYDGAERKVITYDNIGAAPKSHASADAEYGAASATDYGHVKVGVGLEVNNGLISTKYGNEAGTACQGNDSRLTDSRTPKTHAANTTVYGGGNESNYGHVKLTDIFNNEAPNASETGASTSIGASAYALQQAYNTLKSEISKINSITYQTLVPGKWTTTAPFRQSIEVPGFTEETEFSYTYNGEITTDEQAEAWASITSAYSGNGVITFSCYENKPTVNIPVKVRGM